MKKILGLLLLSFCLVSCSNNQEVVNNNEEKKEEVIDNKESISLVDIELSGYKEEFKDGEAFNVGNLKVMGVYSNSTKKEITNFNVDASNFNKDKKGTYTIIVTYLEISKSYNVNVINESGEIDLPLV